MTIPTRILAASAAFAACAALAQPLPAFPPKNVPETFFGTVVDDPYRALEKVKDPEVAAWMKAHADRAHATLQGLKGYGALLKRVAELDNARDTIIADLRRMPDGSLFFTRRGASDNTFKLYVRRADGKESLVADPDDWQRQTGKPHAINYWFPSPDGSHVALGVSASGSEEAVLHVLDTATRKRIGEPIDRAEYAGTNGALELTGNPRWIAGERSGSATTLRLDGVTVGFALAVTANVQAGFCMRMQLSRCVDRQYLPN